MKAEELEGIFSTEENGVTELWYPDGDRLAIVEDNLGLDMEAIDVAHFMTLAPKRIIKFEEALQECKVALVGAKNSLLAFQKATPDSWDNDDSETMRKIIHAITGDEI